MGLLRSNRVTEIVPLWDIDLLVAALLRLHLDADSLATPSNPLRHSVEVTCSSSSLLDLGIQKCVSMKHLLYLVPQLLVWKLFLEVRDKFRSVNVFKEEV